MGKENLSGQMSEVLSRVCNLEKSLHNAHHKLDSLKAGQRVLADVLHAIAEVVKAPVDPDLAAAIGESKAHHEALAKALSEQGFMPPAS